MSNNLSKYYKILKLDERASINEVYLAFDVLTKNETDINKIKCYRNAFEIIMAIKAPDLFVGSDEPIEIDSKNEDCGINKDEKKININFVEHNNNIPLLWLNEFINEHTKTFLGNKFLNASELRSFFDSLVPFYSVNVMITPKFSSDVKYIYKDVKVICDELCKTSGIECSYKKGSNIIVLKLKTPIEIYLTVLAFLNDYCLSNNCEINTVIIE